MDNREGKGSNMMESWRVTSENRLHEKAQWQPVLEAGKMTDKGVGLSDVGAIGTHLVAGKGTFSDPWSSPGFCNKEHSRRPGLPRSDISDWRAECHSSKGQSVTPALSSFI